LFSEVFLNFDCSVPWGSLRFLPPNRSNLKILVWSFFLLVHFARDSDYFFIDCGPGCLHEKLLPSFDFFFLFVIIARTGVFRTSGVLISYPSGLSVMDFPAFFLVYPPSMIRRAQFREYPFFPYSFFQWPVLVKSPLFFFFLSTICCRAQSLSFLL